MVSSCKKVSRSHIKLGQTAFILFIMSVLFHFIPFKKSYKTSCVPKLGSIDLPLFIALLAFFSIHKVLSKDFYLKNRIIPDRKNHKIFY